MLPHEVEASHIVCLSASTCLPTCLLTPAHSPLASAPVLRFLQPGRKEMVSGCDKEGRWVGGWVGG